MEEESTLVALKQKLNEYKSAKYKCQSIRVLKEEEVVRARLIKLWETKKLEEDCDSAFYYGFEKF